MIDELQDNLGLICNNNNNNMFYNVKTWSPTTWAELEVISKILYNTNLITIFESDSQVKINPPRVILESKDDQLNQQSCFLAAVISPYQYRNFIPYDIYLQLNKIIKNKLNDYFCTLKHKINKQCLYITNLMKNLFSLQNSSNMDICLLTVDHFKDLNYKTNY